MDTLYIGAAVSCYLGMGLGAGIAVTDHWTDLRGLKVMGFAVIWGFMLPILLGYKLFKT